MSSDPQDALRNAMAAARRRNTVVQAHISNGAACIDADPVRPQETLRGKLVEEFGEHRIHLRSGRCACGQTVGSDPRRIQHHVADAVLPIVEEETARQLSALRDKVKALADEWERDAADLRFSSPSRALSEHHASRLRALVEEPQGGEQ